MVRGSVRRDGNRVRLTLAMVDGPADAQLWTRQFEMDRANLRPALAEAARSVARSLDVQWQRFEQGTAAALTPQEVQADDLAMQGWHILHRGLNPANLLAAAQLFDAAVTRDPRSVRGWGGVAVANHSGAITGWLPDREAAIERFALAVRRTQGLDENDPSTFLGRVGAAALSGDYDGQLAAATAMVERFPNNPHGHFYRGQALMNLGRFEACVDPARQAIRLGPRDPGVGAWNLQIATCHFMRGEYRQAAVHARSAVQSNPNPPVRALVLAASLARDGDTDEARRIITTFREQYPAYRAQDIASAMASKAPPFAEGRNAMVATLRELGLP
ncbi:MAG TPA: tetratricopeptide repeat protein [Ramlibacter sp.]|nr:tetratricopeptide repeat protein [Ramlibacter sp.]